MVEAAIFSLSFALSLMSCLFAYHAGREADRMIKLSMEAFAHIKAKDMGEVTFAKHFSQPQSQSTKKEPTTFVQEVVKNGRAVDENGNEWEIA